MAFIYKNRFLHVSCKNYDSKCTSLHSWCWYEKLEKHSLVFSIFLNMHMREERVQRQFFYCTFDNRDTISVCHHYGMKTLNTKGGQLVGINLVVSTNSLILSFGCTIK